MKLLLIVASVSTYSVPSGDKLTKDPLEESLLPSISCPTRIDDEPLYWYTRTWPELEPST